MPPIIRSTRIDRSAVAGLCSEATRGCGEELTAVAILETRLSWTNAQGGLGWSSTACHRGRTTEPRNGSGGDATEAEPGAALAYVSSPTRSRTKRAAYQAAGIAAIT